MAARESNPEPNNPLGVDGIEFIEYASSQPQALGSLLQTMGFVPVARHRSREVMLYRQGSMNLIVNSHPDALTGTSAPSATLELNIPGIHGVGDSLIYFVDRYRDFSIYDVDFVPIPGAKAQPPAVAGLHYFGVVQSILGDRTADWVEFYQQLFGFTVLPEGKYFGILP